MAQRYILKHRATAEPLSPSPPADATTEPNYGEVAKVLGGQSVLRRKIKSRFDAHDIVVKGLRGGAVLYILEAAQSLKRDAVASALGMSLRTLARVEANKPLSIEQGSRAWKFAELMEHATRVFGSRPAAERWLAEPVMALDRQVPIELMKTSIGSDLVEELLQRLEYGVYT